MFMHAVMRSINPSNSSCSGQPVLLRAEALPRDEIGAVHVLERLDDLDQESCAALRGALTRGSGSERGHLESWARAARSSAME
jgi:hypothetical protein